MLKNWKEFIREEFIENSENVIDTKMEELSDLISNLSDGNNIMYQWENKESNELVINFLFNDLSIRYEFDIENLKISKIVGENIDFDKKVTSIDGALDIIEKDIHSIIGIGEKSNIKNYFDFIKESNYDSSIKPSDLIDIIDEIKKISKIEIVDNTADIDYLTEELESSLSNYDKEVIEEVIDLMLFNYPDVSEDYIIDKIIKLGDMIFNKYGTEPSMVLSAFEDAFMELSKHFYISEKKKRGRPKAGRTKSGKKVPGKYLTRNRKKMKKEIEEFKGKETYKTEWDADYKSGKGGKGKRWKTKKSAATKAYQKKYGNKKKK